METGATNKKPTRPILWSCGIIVACAGILNFAFAIVGWILLTHLALTGRPRVVDWSYLWLAAPAPILLAVFLCAVLLRKRRRVFWLLLSIGVFTSFVWSVYDAWRDNYQIQMMTRDEGCTHTYCNWPWMDGKNDQIVQRLLGPPPKWRWRPDPRFRTIESQPVDGNALPG